MTEEKDKMGHNVNTLKAEIKEAYKNVTQLKLDRQGINADIQAIREKLESQGLKKEAFDMALRYLAWDPEKREGFDLAYDLIREALDHPIHAQGDFFEDKAEALKREVKVQKNAEALADE